MTIMKSLFLSFVFIFSAFIASSQSYKIDVQIKDLKNVDIYLGYYYGDKTYVKDTIQLDENGKGTFTGDSLLDQGMYIVVMPNKNYFDILVGSDQEFSLTTTSTELVKSLEIKGSTENEALKEFQNFMIANNKEVMEKQARLKQLEVGNDSVEILNKEIEEISERVQNYWDETIEKNADNFLGVLVKAMKNPQIPDIEIPDEIENKDSVRWFHSYNYNRAHYFDNIDFTDKRFLRTPIFHNKVETFFTKILVQNPDTINKYIDIVMADAVKDKDMFRYTLQLLYNKFVNSNIMGMDKVYYHIAEKYYLSDDVDWLDDETITKIKELVAKHRYNQIGNAGQDLKMETLNLEYARLYDIDAKFILVMFWEPNCGHCKKVVPEVHKIYQEFSRDEFEVFAVYTQTDKEEWANYVNEHGYDDWINVWDPYNLTNFRLFYNVYSTPTLYLLDENKKIFAKRIGHETLKEILEMELGKKEE